MFHKSINPHLLEYKDENHKFNINVLDRDNSMDHSK